MMQSLRCHRDDFGSTTVPILSIANYECKVHGKLSENDWAIVSEPFKAHLGTSEVSDGVNFFKPSASSVESCTSSGHIETQSDHSADSSEDANLPVSVSSRDTAIITHYEHAPRNKSNSACVDDISNQTDHIKRENSNVVFDGSASNEEQPLKRRKSAGSINTFCATTPPAPSSRPASCHNEEDRENDQFPSAGRNDTSDLTLRSVRSCILSCRVNSHGVPRTRLTRSISRTQLAPSFITMLSRLTTSPPPRTLP